MKVLICCRDGLFGSFLAHRVGLLGWEVTLVPDCPDHLREFLDCSYDVAILNIRYPFYNSLEILDLVKGACDRPAIFILSGIYTEEIIRRAYASGVDEYLSMPLNLQRLLKKLLRRAKSRKPNCHEALT